MNQKGFTLVEVLVVIAIIGLITVMVFPAVAQLTKKHEKSSCDYYEEILVEKTKLLIDQKRKDLPSLETGGSVTFTYQEINKEFPIAKTNNLDCSSGSSVTITKKNNKYQYQVTLSCKDKKGEEACKAS